MLWAGISNFKFRIVFWNFFFGDLVKRMAILKKKSHLACGRQLEIKVHVLQGSTEGGFLKLGQTY